MALNFACATGLAKAASLSNRACDILGWKGRLLQGRGGADQGAEKGESHLPTCGGGTAGRPRGSPLHSGGPGLRRQGDRAGEPAGEPDPVRHGLLRHQLLKTPHLGGGSIAISSNFYPLILP